MNVLSLFDGISGGMLACTRAGIKIDNYFASEIDKDAINVSEYNWNNITRLGDVCDYKSWRLPKIDLLVGGSPCQGFSRNGSCLNFNDPRSKLFFKYVEILHELRKSNPDIKFLLENVEMKKEWVNVIDDFLGVKGVLINSKLLSAQSRPRIYWANWNISLPVDNDIRLIDILDKVDTSDFILKDGILFDPRYSVSNISLVQNVDGEIRIKQATKQGYAIAKNGDGINLSFPKSKTRRGRVISQKSGTLDCQCDSGVIYDNIVRKFTISELEKLQTLPVGYTKILTDNKRKKVIGNGWTIDVVAYILCQM